MRTNCIAVSPASPDTIYAGDEDKGFYRGPAGTDRSTPPIMAPDTEFFACAADMPARLIVRQCVPARRNGYDNDMTANTVDHALPHKETIVQDTEDGQGPDSGKSVSIIFNPVSGSGDPEVRKKLISDALAEHGYRCQFIATSEKQGAKQLAEDALKKGGIDLLVVAGGDGTVMEVLEAVAGKDIPVAVIPSGTGNLLSVNLGIPTKVPDAVHVALSGEQYKLDLGCTSLGTRFAIMGGLGIDAQMIHDADRKAKKRLGVFAYLWAALKNLPRRRELVEITLDDRPAMSRRVKTVLIANMGKITGGMEAMPTASPNDGRLDVGIVTAETLGQWLRLASYALIGRTNDAPDMDVHQAKKIHIRTPRPQLVQFDGEDAGEHQEWHVDVEPAAVRIMLPKEGPAAKDTVGSPKALAEARSMSTVRVGILVGVAATAVALVIRKRRGSGS